MSENGPDPLTDLKDVEFPDNRDECISAILAARNYIYDKNGASKHEIIENLKSEGHFLIGISGGQAKKVGAMEKYREWWWQRVIQSGLSALSDISEPASDLEDWIPDSEFGHVHEKVLNTLSPTDGQAVSSATIIEDVDEDSSEISEAIHDLLRLGELEFVNTSGSNMHVRVRLRRPITNTSSQMTLSGDHFKTCWRSYIVDGSDPKSKHANRLFSSRENAKLHILEISGCDELTPVTVLEDVWYRYLGDWENEYAVLRKEPIFSQFDSPWE